MRPCFTLLTLIAFLLTIETLHLYPGQKSENNTIQRRSSLSATRSISSYPQPFSKEPSNPNRTSIVPAVSTGYYVVDSDDDADAIYKQYPFLSPVNEIDLSQQPQSWKSILSGAHQQPLNFWLNNPEGKSFFQNPATASTQFPLGMDSTDNAFAGPIPIGFPFVFNGIRYDSFYVSTNGMIAFSNRRYFYDAAGNRTQKQISAGTFSYYDPESEDSRALQGSSGATDTTPDDYGYRCIALGQPPGIAAITHSSTQSNDGLRNPDFTVNGDGIAAIQNFTNNAPLILPCWGNLQMSVFDAAHNKVDSLATVKYKRSTDGNRLIIWLRNLTPIGPWNVFDKGQQYSTVNYASNVRPGSDNFIEASIAVILNKIDSSVYIYFTDFQGEVKVNNKTFSAAQMFLMNSTMAIRGTARHQNYNSRTQTSGTRTPYQQYTVCYTRLAHGSNPALLLNSNNQSTPNYPAPGLVTCFRQWKNSLRAVGIEYGVNHLDANSALDYSLTAPANNTDNFEVLAGDNRLGSITPMPIFQNLSNDLQSPSGVNYQRQNLRFKASVKILNQLTGILVYDKTITTGPVYSDNRTWTSNGYRLGTFQRNASNTADVFANYNPMPDANGIAPYSYVQLKFPPFVPNENVKNQCGRLKVIVTAQSVDSTGQPIGDSWAFDDTLVNNLYVMKRITSTNLSDRNFQFFNEQTLFEKEGSIAVPTSDSWINLGAEVVDGEVNTNVPPAPQIKSAATNDTAFKIQTPVYRLNRLNGTSEPLSYPGGDELRSMPIDLRDKKGAVLSFAYHRGTKRSDYARNWADSILIGPEPFNNLPGTLPAGFGSTQVPGNDELVVELMRPSPDGIKYITANVIPGSNTVQWNWHPRPNNQSPIADNPAYTLYGGGGCRHGFYYTAGTNTPTDSVLTRAQGLVVDSYDDGKDHEWKKVFIPIPDTLINAPIGGARNFRFRLKVNAYKHEWKDSPQDDADDFYVKNVRILYPTEVTDISVVSVNVPNPYDEMPETQATSIPLWVRIANNTGRDAQAFKIAVIILNVLDPDPKWEWYWEPGKDLWLVSNFYFKSVTIPFMIGNLSIQIPFPSFNARTLVESVTNRYILASKISYPGGDLEPTNDSITSSFSLKLGSTFSNYPSLERNKVPEYYERSTGTSGAGKGLEQNSDGSPYGLAKSGQIAMFFNIVQADTIKGFQAWFGSANVSATPIYFSLYSSNGLSLPNSVPILGSTLSKFRGIDVDGERRFDTTTTYLYKTPVVLQPGVYWAAVGTPSSARMELGASDSHSGMQKINGHSLLIDKLYRRAYNRSGELHNYTRFAYENGYGSGQWSDFTPTNGSPAYPYRNANGQIGDGYSYTNGSWIPMIRPYFGEKVFHKVVPVELMNFDGASRNNAIDLWWQTASEKDNFGFYVERRTDVNDVWTDLNFVSSLAAANGSSSSVLNYNTSDNTVKSDTKYYYRLRQVDLDGTTSYSGILNFQLIGMDQNILESIYPNPVSDVTTISIMNSRRDLVRLDIVDLFGNQVCTLVDETLEAGRKTVEWTGVNSHGILVANGTYLVRLNVVGVVETRRICVVR